MLFGISGTELMVILVIALVLVGPDKLPDYARKGLDDATQDVNRLLPPIR